MLIYDATNESGFVQEVHDICGTNDTTYSLKKICRRLNLALNDFFLLVMKTCGDWSVEDNANTDIAIARTDLIQNQQDYSVSNDMLVIEDVRVIGADGEYHKLDVLLSLPESKQTGLPTSYFKKGNSLFMFPIPSSALSAGLEISYRRNFSVVTVSSTTFSPTTLSVPAIANNYLIHKVCLPQLVRDNKAIKNDINTLLSKDESDIAEYYNSRERDVQAQINVVERDYR